MGDSILLQEMIFTPITSNLKLRPNSDDGPSFLRPSNRLLDVPYIVIKIHRPLIQIASRDL